jgi:hypothetical protein
MSEGWGTCEINKDEEKERVIQYRYAVMLVHVAVVFPLLEPYGKEGEREYRE